MEEGGRAHTGQRRAAGEWRRQWVALRGGVERGRTAGGGAGLELDMTEHLGAEPDAAEAGARRG
jgi:hypothetical protein